MAGDNDIRGRDETVTTDVQTREHPRQHEIDAELRNELVTTAGWFPLFAPSVSLDELARYVMSPQAQQGASSGVYENALGSAFLHQAAVVERDSDEPGHVHRRDVKQAQSEVNAQDVIDIAQRALFGSGVQLDDNINATSLSVRLGRIQARRDRQAPSEDLRGRDDTSLVGR